MNVLTVPATSSLSTGTWPPSVPLKQSDASYWNNVSLEEKVTLLLVRDLVRLGWRFSSSRRKSIELVPPETYEKNVVKQAMAFARNDSIEANRSWIDEHLPLCRANLAKGSDVVKSEIKPRIEVCTKPKQHDLFRLFRYSWSSPYSDYIGRRLRLLIRDDSIASSPVIGIAALGSSIIHIPDRDKWIGWDVTTRTERIIYMMDAYVIGALPPYNLLLGGKLISYLLASNEVRELYRQKYANVNTVINKRKASDLALIVTTSLYGSRSSQYNRLRYGKRLLYRPIGTTSGFGSLHISNETFLAMRQLAESKGVNTSNKFGMGPNWRMRVIRSACDILGLDAGIILKHSFQRGLFAIPVSANFRAFLTGKSKTVRYRDLPAEELVNHWKKRWLSMRKQNDLIVQRVKDFEPETFDLKKTPFEAPGEQPTSNRR